MKKYFTVFIIMSLIILGQTADKTHVVHSRSTGAPLGHTGSPADGKTCTTIGCHAGPSALPVPNLIASKKVQHSKERPTLTTIERFHRPRSRSKEIGF